MCQICRRRNFDIYENILPTGNHSYTYVTNALDRHFEPPRGIQTIRK